MPRAVKGLEANKSVQLLDRKIPSLGGIQCSTPLLAPCPAGFRLMNFLTFPVRSQYASSVSEPEYRSMNSW